MSGSSRSAVFVPCAVLVSNVTARFRSRWNRCRLLKVTDSAIDFLASQEWSSKSFAYPKSLREYLIDCCLARRTRLYLYFLLAFHLLHSGTQQQHTFGSIIKAKSENTLCTMYKKELHILEDCKAIQKFTKTLGGPPARMFHRQTSNQSLQIPQ